MTTLDVVPRNDPRVVDPDGPDVRDEGDALDLMITFLIRCGGGTAMSDFGRAFEGYSLFMLRQWFTCRRPDDRPDDVQIELPGVHELNQDPTAIRDYILRNRKTMCCKKEHELIFKVQTCNDNCTSCKRK